MEKLHLGDPLDKSTDIGAINSFAQLEKIKNLVARGAKEGAKVYQPKLTIPKQGFFYPPTLLEEAHQSMDICQTEIFGPVLSILPFRTPTEAIAIANNSRYGLSASVWTENINLGLDLAPKIKVGVVWINSTNLFDFSQYTLVPMDPGVQSTPSYFDNYWNSGTINSFSLEIFNVETGQESICFFFSAFNCLADEDCEDCCSEVLCFDLPPCPESSLFDFDSDLE